MNFCIHINNCNLYFDVLGICEPKSDPKCQAAASNDTVDCVESSSGECDKEMTTTTAKPDEQNNTKNDENTAGSSDEEKSIEWNKKTKILVAFGAIAFLLLVGLIIKVILHFLK